MGTYVCARDLDGVPIGTHQMIVIVPDGLSVGRAFTRLHDHVETIALGGGRLGFTIAGHNVSGHLTMLINQPADVAAVREGWGAAVRTWRASDWDTECRQVHHGVSGIEFMWAVLRAAENYMIHSRTRPVRYGITGNNCNKLAQSIIAYARGKVGSDFSGLDLNHDGRFPMSLFDD